MLLVDCTEALEKRIEVQGGVKEDNNIELLLSPERERERVGRPSLLLSYGRARFISIQFPLSFFLYLSLLRVLCYDSILPSLLSSTSLFPASSSVQHLRVYENASERERERE